MKNLPNDVKAYSRTNTFTHETVPQKLLKNHNTKVGTWGVIHIEQGEIEYTIEDNEVVILSKDKLGIIEPTIPHYITPLGEVSFYLEFYK